VGKIKRFKVVVTDYDFPSVEIEREILNRVNADLIELENTDEKYLMEATQNADGMLVQRAPITRRVIQNFTKCKIISRYAVGLDKIDVEAATERGIFVTNVPDYCIQEVSDHTLTLILCCARKITFLDREVRRRVWEPRSAKGIPRLKGQTLGLIGFGNVARALTVKAKTIGFRILAYDPYVKSSIFLKYKVRKSTFEDLLREADFISLHIPLTGETEKVIGAKEFQMMKRTCFFINTARGKVVDQKALVDALKKGLIAGAGIDVMEQEPPDLRDPLLKMPNVVITPHVAYYSDESERELRRKAAEQVALVLNGKIPKYIVNK
jgi:D-3-phosphoglycerate dehydrogenase